MPLLYVWVQHLPVHDCLIRPADEPMSGHTLQVNDCLIRPAVEGTENVLGVQPCCRSNAATANVDCPSGDVTRLAGCLPCFHSCRVLQPVQHCQACRSHVLCGSYLWGRGRSGTWARLHGAGASPASSRACWACPRASATLGFSSAAQAALQLEKEPWSMVVV